ncbi:MAG: acetyl-CoA carboxylase biotin carboxylase subunit, partial [Bradymonadia bacterium]
MFEKVLIANRGEIAVRVMRTLREMGILSVAVYSDADADAVHVQYADEAIHVGGSASAESYLVMERILAACKKTGAQAVHPGYGFLSENTDFAAACEAAGVTFIGPPSSAITAMGEKTQARRLMIAAGVPVVPGTQHAIPTAEEALVIAKEMKFPVLIKAAAGGGGKGMRRVDDEGTFLAAFAGAQREAVAAFGNGDCYIEKWILQPKHVEIQILADRHGNTVHLFERDCSVQRRHQKVVEESPCHILRDEVRQQMGRVAVQAAQAVNYVGAGTVEFLIDVDQNFYFLEMNTRLQVEHPITEAVTGVDLVEQQIRV